MSSRIVLCSQTLHCPHYKGLSFQLKMGLATLLMWCLIKFSEIRLSNISYHVLVKQVQQLLTVTCGYCVFIWLHICTNSYFYGHNTCNSWWASRAHCSIALNDMHPIGTRNLTCMVDMRLLAQPKQDRQHESVNELINCMYYILNNTNSIQVDKYFS